MRISDWSSDVCSSDLAARSRCAAFARRLRTRRRSIINGFASPRRSATIRCSTAVSSPSPPTWDSCHRRCCRTRSEEHTSELQSLMRISYAVFCLKKKKKKHIQHTEYLYHTNPNENTTRQHGY